MRVLPIAVTNKPTAAARAGSRLYVHYSTLIGMSQVTEQISCATFKNTSEVEWDEHPAYCCNQ
jgi:hypothetical protein